MTKQCVVCGTFDGQTYWKVVEGTLGGPDGKAKGIIRLKTRKAVVLEFGLEETIEVHFCAKEEAEAWAESQGRRFVRWER